MADDQFTAEMEWLLRLRREAYAIKRVLRRMRQYHMLAYSTQKVRDIRTWASEENLLLNEEVERVEEVLDKTFAKFLVEPTVRADWLGPDKPMALPFPPAGEAPDLRPIKGRGRRHGFIRKVEQ